MSESYKGLDAPYVIAKGYIEVQCICGNYVAFRSDAPSVNATMCPKCKAVILRSTIDKQKK
jgi:hypothetical protein